MYSPFGFVNNGGDRAYNSFYTKNNKTKTTDSTSSILTEINSPCEFSVCANGEINISTGCDINISGQNIILEGNLISNNDIVTNLIYVEEIVSNFIVVNEIEGSPNININGDLFVENIISNETAIFNNLVSGNVNAMNITSNIIETETLYSNNIITNSINLCTNGELFVNNITGCPNITFSGDTFFGNIYSNAILTPSLETTVLNSITLITENIETSLINTEVLTSIQLNSELLLSNNITTNDLLSLSVNTEELITNNITALFITSNEMNSNIINANSMNTVYLDVSLLNANIISYNSIFSNVIIMNNFIYNTLSAETLITGNIISNNATMIELNTIDLFSNNITVFDLNILSNVESNSITTVELITTNLISNNIVTLETLTTNLISNNIVTLETLTTNLTSTNAIITNQISNVLQVTNLIDVNNLVVNNAFVNQNLIVSGTLLTDDVVFVNLNAININSSSGIYSNIIISNHIDTFVMNSNTIQSIEINSSNVLSINLISTNIESENVYCNYLECLNLNCVDFSAVNINAVNLVVNNTINVDNILAVNISLDTLTSTNIITNDLLTTNLITTDLITGNILSTNLFISGNVDIPGLNLQTTFPLSINNGNISLQTGLKGQLLYNTGLGYQLRTGLGPFDFIVGTDPGDTSTLEEALIAAGNTFNANINTLKVFIKNSILEPNTITVPINTKLLVVLGPGVTWTITNKILLNTSGGNTDPVSINIEGQSALSSTLSFDLPDFLIDIIGPNNSNTCFRNLRVLKRQITHTLNSTLINPVSNGVHQIYENVTFCIGGNTSNFLGSDGISNAIYNISLLNCTFNGSLINPNSPYTIDNFLNVTNTGSYVIIENFSIFCATPNNGTIFTVINTAQNLCTINNLRIANDLLNNGNISVIVFAGAKLNNVRQINTIGTSNVHLNIAPTINWPTGSTYNTIYLKSVLIAPLISITKCTFSDIDCVDTFGFVTTALTTNTLINCTFDRVFCNTLTKGLNFDIQNCSFHNFVSNIVTGFNTSNITNCLFNNFTINTNTIFTFSGNNCVFTELKATGTLDFTESIGTHISNSYLTTNITIPTSGSILTDCSTSANVIITNTANPLPVIISKVYSLNTATSLIVPISLANTVLNVLNCIFGNINLTGIVTNNLQGSVKILGCTFNNNLTTSTIATSNLILTDSLFHHQLNTSGFRVIVKGITSTNHSNPFAWQHTIGNTVKANNCIFAATNGITFGNTVSDVTLSEVSTLGNISFTNPTGNLYSVNLCVANAYNFILTQSNTKAIGCIGTLPLFLLVSLGNSLL